MKRALFVDFDGTLLETDDAFNAFLLAHYGVTIPKSSYHCGYSMETLLLNQIPENRRPALGAFYEHVGLEYLTSHDWHKDATPIPGSVEAMARLSTSYDLYIVTARQTVSRPVVEALVEKFFPRMIRGVHYAYTCIGDGKFEKVPKRDFIAGFNPAIRAGFVDDNPIEIQDAADIVPSFLFDPLDRHPNADHYARISCWHALADRLL